MSFNGLLLNFFLYRFLDRRIFGFLNRSSFLLGFYLFIFRGRILLISIIFIVFFIIIVV